MERLTSDTPASGVREGSVDASGVGVMKRVMIAAKAGTRSAFDRLSTVKERVL